MIVEFRIFEGKEDNWYWVIPFDYRLEGALKKLKAPKVFIKSMIGIRMRKNLDKGFIYDKDFLYVYTSKNKHGINMKEKIDWGFCFYEKKYEKPWDEYNFGGYIDVNEHEVVAKRYNL